MKSVLSAAALCIAISALATQGASITIDANTRYQTIDGFGGSIAHEMWSLKHYDQSYYDMIVKDLGVSLVRLFLQPDFEPLQGTFNTTTGAAGTLLGICRMLSTAGIHSAAPTVFTPPPWMKDNNDEVGGSLREDMYDAFAEYYVEYVRAIENCGLEVSAVSPENEPAWAQWYVSCVYSVKQMHDIVVRMGQRFAAEGMPVRIFSAEDVYTNSWKLYAKATVGNPIASQYTTIAAVHANAHRPTATDISKYREDRDLLESYAATLGKPPYSIGYWNSEVHATAIDGSEADAWADAVDMAQSIQVSLRDAKMSAWLMGSITVPEVDNAGTETIMIGQTPGHRYHACKQFFRYIRPDAVMVDAACDDADVMATAFTHGDQQTMTVVLVNPTGGPKSVSLAVDGANAQQFTQIRTSRTETCDTIGTVASSVVLPASSITTLYAEDVATSAHAPRATRALAPQTGYASTYDLCGRRITDLARPIGCTVVKNANGAVVSLGALEGRKLR